VPQRKTVVRARANDRPRTVSTCSTDARAGLVLHALLSITNQQSRANLDDRPDRGASFHLQSRQQFRGAPVPAVFGVDGLQSPFVVLQNAVALGEKQLVSAPFVIRSKRIGETAANASLTIRLRSFSSSGRCEKVSEESKVGASVSLIKSRPFLHPEI
jgi:hypothetical protein